jgi:hypothetical protein
MKNFSMLMPKGFASAMMLGIAAATSFVVVAPAHAANLSFAGNFTNPDDTTSLTSQSFTFAADGISTVTIQSSSWAAGGFDPVLTLFDANNGNYILEREDISSSPENLDFQIIEVLPARNYRAVVSVVGNYANGSLFTGGNISNGFSGGGAIFPGQTLAYAFVINNVNNQVATAVPEPSDMIGTVVAGCGAVLFRRKLLAGKKQN